jgi:hypothetical protein
MKRLAPLALALLVTGCKGEASKERTPPAAAEPATATSGFAAAASPGPAPAPAANGPTAGGSSSAKAPGANAKPTGFAPFDRATAGAAPWVDPGDAGGVVELHAVDDLSGRTGGKFFVERRCGADAPKAIEAVGKRLDRRAGDASYDPVKCRPEGDIMACFQPGVSEDDAALVVEYVKATDGVTWRVRGVKTYAMGVTLDKYEAKYAALVKGACK